MNSDENLLNEKLISHMIWTLKFHDIIPRDGILAPTELLFHRDYEKIKVNNDELPTSYGITIFIT